MKNIKSLEEYLNLSPLIIDTSTEVLDSKEKFEIKKDIFMYSKFRNDQLSNNHVLAASALLFNQLRRVQRGDQIYLKGYLAEYSHSNGKFYRGTSTCRTDTGNGACETIFVTDFKMLRQANALWRGVYLWSRILIVLSLIFWFASSLKSNQGEI